MSTSLKSARNSRVKRPQKAPAPASDNSVLKLNLADRIENIATALGTKTELAKTLGVSVSQPTRWANGIETPNSENIRSLIDLDHVISRASLIWGDRDTVKVWLNSPNSFLWGSKPIDIIILSGSSSVIDALDQEMAGAYA